MFNPGLGQYHRHVNINQQYVRYSKHIRYPDFQPRSSVPRIVVILCFAPADVFKFVPFFVTIVSNCTIGCHNQAPSESDLYSGQSWSSNVRPDKLVLDTEINEDTATGHKTRCNSDDDGNNANSDDDVDVIDDDSEDGD